MTESQEADQAQDRQDDEPVEPEIVDDVPETGDAETAGTDEVADDLSTLEDELDHLRDSLVRARADYDNLQKRVARDAALERERVKARFLEDFLRVFEYSQMAATEAEKQPGPLAEGVKMVHKEFQRLLEQEGLVPFGAVGDRFDATLHEAVETVAAKDVKGGHVARVVKPGYRLGERILRYAKVAVAGDE